MQYSAARKRAGTIPGGPMYQKNSGKVAGGRQTIFPSFSFISIIK
jgi:hypothetical protein